MKAFAFAFVFTGALAFTLAGAAAPALGNETVVRSVHVVDALAKNERSLAPLDPLGARLVREGRFAAQRDGDPAPGAPGAEAKRWRRATLDADGRLDDKGFAAGGWAQLEVESAQARTVLVEARGAASLWIAGSLRTADIYASGQLRVPIELRAGPNLLLLRGGRGPLRLRITPAPAAPFIETLDTTLPDLVEDGSAGERFVAGIVVVNPLPTWSPALTLRAQLAGTDTRPVDTAVPPLPPLALRKIAIGFDAPRFERQRHSQTIALDLELRGAAAAALPLSSARVMLSIVPSGAHRQVTFTSAIDGSAQYFGLLPATQPGPQGLLLALHGASVEGQWALRAYTAKPWVHIVAPTNRRPFGFNWEEWGTADVKEVLAQARRLLAPDPARIAITGHSMGGHGTWINGTLMADEFAALAPIAGWATIWSYASAPRPRSGPDADPVERILRRAGNLADSVALLPNLAGKGLYIKHPGEDESVPVKESDTMAAELRKLGLPFDYFVRGGILHWPDSSVMDWPPLFDAIQPRRRVADSERSTVEFVTFDPAVSHKLGWVEVHQQQRALESSHVNARIERAGAQLIVETQNVRRLKLDSTSLRGHPALRGQRELPLRLDGSALRLPLAAPAAWFERDGDTGPWRAGGPTPAGEKGIARGGRIQAAMANRLFIVVGTAGSAGENAALLDQARYLAELFMVRGNFDLRIVSDEEFLRAPDGAEFGGRNVLVIGSRDTHRAWPTLLPATPIDVTRGRVAVGARTLAGDDLAVAFVRPRPGSDTASVVVVAGSGRAGTALAQRLPLHAPNLGLADWIVAGPEMLERGWAGIRGTGFFDPLWRLSDSDTGWSPDHPAAGGTLAR